jgi:hypothetical protein
MVFTVPVRMRRGHTRRSVLVAMAASTVAGCALFDDTPSWKPGNDGLDTILADALALISSYTATIAASSALDARLRPLLEDHRAHAAALTRELSGGATAPPTAPPASSAAAPSQPAATLAALAAAERAAADRATRACLGASSWRAALLGSIAACRASHVEALT